MVEGVERLAHHAIAGHAPSSRGNARHPMRDVTRRAAGLAPGTWDDDRKLVVEVFDELAPEWHTRDTPERREVVADAFGRGLAALGDRPDLGRASFGVEAGSGTGTYSSIVASAVAVAVAVDLSMEMLREAPEGTAHRVCADASRLPFRDGSVDLVVLVNALLFPLEVARVLRPGGVLVWVNVSGPETPIHLTTEELVTSLPFRVRGVESTAGAGTWCVLGREPDREGEDG